MPRDTHARILNLYTVYTALDSELVAGALGIRRALASTHLSQMAVAREVSSRPRRCWRRPRVQTEYVREVH